MTLLYQGQCSRTNCRLWGSFQIDGKEWSHINIASVNDDLESDGREETGVQPGFACFSLIDNGVGKISEALPLCHHLDKGNAISSGHSSPIPVRSASEPEPSFMGSRPLKPTWCYPGQGVARFLEEYLYEVLGKFSPV
jgi:hypothetical protein